MNNDEFSPLARMPIEIERALFGGTESSTDADEEEGEGSMPIPAVNPWLAKAGTNGVLEYVNEDNEEKELFRALQPLEKLFSPDVFTTAATVQEAPHFQFSKRTTEPATQDALQKRAPKEDLAALTFKTRRDENGFLWNEGFDAAGELKCCRIV